MLRPDVVLFGEFLSDKSLDQMSRLQDAGIDLVISIGTSSLFPYITGPVELAHEFGISCVEINPEKTTVSRLCDYRLRESCTVALEEIERRVRKEL
jgi:NAD-dependent deacetylase